MKKDFYIVGLGTSNWNAQKTCREVLAALEKHPSIHLISFSSLYPNMGKHCPQPRLFSNVSIMLSTFLCADALWFELHKIEQNYGRIRTIKNGPRTIDIDILWHSGNSINSQHLQVPHQLFFQRPFALIPSKDLKGLGIEKNIFLKNHIQKSQQHMELKMPGQSLEKIQRGSL